MSLTQVVLVDQTHEIDPSLLHAAAIALNQQATQDLPKVWGGITAAVSAAPSLAAVPHGAWPVFLVKKLPPGEGGFHLDKNNQPYSKVIASPADESWTIDASHEIIEMLVDPYGNRMQSSQAVEISSDSRDVVDALGSFSYLVEACDPCEANNFGYDIGGILVSDFITPNFYDASVAQNTLYSFRGNITRPRQLLPGGYISYRKPDGSWQQILWVDPNSGPQYNALGDTSAAVSLRERVHELMGQDIDERKHAARRNGGKAHTSILAHIEAARQFRNAKAGREAELRERYKLR